MMTTSRSVRLLRTLRMRKLKALDLPVPMPPSSSMCRESICSPTGMRMGSPRALWPMRKKWGSLSWYWQVSNSRLPENTSCE